MLGIDLGYTVRWWKNTLGLGGPSPVPTTPPPPEPIAPVVSKPIESIASDLKFSPGNVISDQEFTNYNCMTEEQIQDFFVRKGGCILPNYSIRGHLASYWLATHCKENGINPKIIITHIQKEQGGITRKTPFAKQRTYDYLLGVGATDGGDNAKWAGVDNQILGSIQTCKKWYDKGLALNFPTIVAASDRPNLSIENAATYSLYKYTPWVGDMDKQIGKNLYKVPFGNYLFWKIYNSPTFWT